MFKVEVISGPKTIHYTDKKTGRASSFEVQQAVLHVPGQKYPDRFELSAPRELGAYALGVYELLPESIYVSGSRLSVFPKLKAIAAVPAARAAG